MNDDWRARPNLTFSYGLRYETQNNISDHGDFSPRVALAWGIDAKGSTPARTVLRAGFGIFFDRVNENVTLNELRFNGVTQQSYFIIDPSFYPAIPTLAALAAGKQPQSLQYVDSGLKASHTYQTSIGVDRQITKSVKISAAYLNGRGTHLSRSRDINAPIGGLFPYGDSQLRYLTESTGFSRTNQIQVTPSVNYKKLFVFGFYALSYGRTDAEGQAADPYNLRAGMGTVEFRRRTASHGGGHQPAAAVEDLGEPVHHGIERSAVQHLHGARYQRRQHHDGAAVDCGAGGGAVHGTRFVLRGELRLLQSESGAGDEHQPQLRARSGIVQYVGARGAHVDDRRQGRGAGRYGRHDDGRPGRRWSGRRRHARRRRTASGRRWRHDGRASSGHDGRAAPTRRPAGGTRSR